MFHNRTGKYMRPSDKGKVFCCRICTLREAFSGKVVRKVDGKFTVLVLSRKEAIKEFFKP